MSLVFAAIAPHPPILIPTIGKEHVKKIQTTQEAMDKLEKNLYVARPDTIIVISPHGHILPEAFSINISPSYKVDLREFGDLTTNNEYHCDMNLALQIGELAKLKHLPLILQTDPVLDYGSTVPLFFLARHLPEIRIIPIGYSLLDAKTHLDFGYLIKEEIMNSNRRVAVIASGDLSHALTDSAPGGFSPEGKRFDEAILEGLKSHNTTALLNLDPKVCQSAAECGLRSILILLGALQRVNYELKVISYEGPLGVGYLVAEFVMK